MDAEPLSHQSDGPLDAGLEVLQSASEFDSDEGDGDYHTYAYSDPFEWAY